MEILTKLINILVLISIYLLVVGYIIIQIYSFIRKYLYIPIIDFIKEIKTYYNTRPVALVTIHYNVKKEMDRRHIDYRYNSNHFRVPKNDLKYSWLTTND